ncbi:type II toxin-antitoxin system prevent-host-death family antitoxin [uncultured Enorma sp.]|uniref:type II toxin-antitoxin system Phd/YefM family antitoxin n=1 Tax=uncultured Enorma sp. TaxID=1714346 RepID=UPI002805B1B4|nr:type II toxin-antitoxin system prevent-host-death family antitoxin [uncultured Enorma sp.]
MEAVAYSTFRSNLRSYMDKTREDAEPILVTAKDPSANVVVLNVRDYENLIENARIMNNPYLMDKLRRGREQVRAGEVSEHKLAETADA